VSFNSYRDGTGSLSPLDIFVDAPLIANFFVLLQQGVRIRRRVGCTVDAFLRQDIDVSPETIERIQSIMLDGKPVDDIGSAIVQDGATLALSAAMPGLVGATLRRGGAYASFRSTITYREMEQPHASGEGLVVIKLFNLLMAELGPGLLQKGVLLEAAVLLGFLADREQELREGCRIMLGGRLVTIDWLRADEVWAGAGLLSLTVSSGQVGR
jgi:hypothetical protein